MLSAAVVALVIYGIRKRNLTDEEAYKKYISGLSNPNQKAKKVWFHGNNFF